MKNVHGGILICDVLFVTAAILLGIEMADAGTHRMKIASFCRFCGKTASSKKTSARPKEKFKLEFERHGVNVEECKMGSWHLPFSVRSLDLFCHFIRVY